MRARLRAPGGASTISLPDDATIEDLITQIIEKTSIKKFDVKYGYPPRPLLLNQQDKSLPLSSLNVKLDGEQLTISPREDEADRGTNKTESSKQDKTSSANKSSIPSSGFSFTGDSVPVETPQKERKQVSLQRKAMEGDVPEIPLPERGATLGMSVTKHVGQY